MALFNSAGATGLDRIFSTSASIASRAAVNLSASTTALMPSKPGIAGAVGPGIHAVHQPLFSRNSPRCWQLCVAADAVRAFYEVREKKGLVKQRGCLDYSPGNAGLLGMSAVVDADKFTAARDAMLAEVEKMRPDRSAR